MKKILLLLAMTGTLAFTGCTNDDEPDIIENNYTVKAEVFELSNVDFDPSNQFSILYNLGTAPLQPADMILVYRLRNVLEGRDIWELIPRTYYFANEQELDYDYNFTRNDIELYLSFTDGLNMAAIPEFTQNQVFRIMIIPGWDNTARLDKTDYEAVANRYGISESNIKKIAK